MGADLVSQAFILSTAIGFLLLEYYRSSTASALAAEEKQREKAARAVVREARLQGIESRLDELTRRFAEAEASRSSGSWLPSLPHLSITGAASSVQSAKERHAVTPPTPPPPPASEPLPSTRLHATAAGATLPPQPPPESSIEDEPYLSVLEDQLRAAAAAEATGDPTSHTRQYTTGGELLSPAPPPSWRSLWGWWGTGRAGGAGPIAVPELR